MSHYKSIIPNCIVIIIQNMILSISVYFTVRILIFGSNSKCRISLIFGSNSKCRISPRSLCASHENTVQHSLAFPPSRNHFLRPTSIIYVSTKTSFIYAAIIMHWSGWDDIRETFPTSFRPRSTSMMCSAHCFASLSSSASNILSSSTVFPLLTVPANGRLTILFCS